MYEPSKNKIVEYYRPDDERLGEYYQDHAELLGLHKHPFGLDQNGVLRFEETPTKSQIWLDHQTQDLNQIWTNYHRGKYTMADMMQFYREIGYSLCGYVDVWSDKYYPLADQVKFQKALNKLRGKKSIQEAKQEILEMIFLGHLDSVEEQIVFQYRKEAKKIIEDNFGTEAWEEFIGSIKRSNN